MEGFKFFEFDWTCRGFQYVVGETYEEDVEPVCCDRGFHFCKELKDCFNYYPFNPENKVAEVLALGDIDEKSDNSKCCTNKIQIVKEISWEEVLRMVNLGKGNAGLCNTGDRNTGDRNTGGRNTGNWNTGSWNTGNCNTGNRNTGEWNYSSFNSGCFNIDGHEILIFDKPSDMSYGDWTKSDARYLLNLIPKNIVEWISSNDMTDEEKEKHPEYKTTEGYLKVLDESECGQIWWNGLSEHNKEVIRAIPNFDSIRFEMCTGIRVDRR